MRYQAADSRYSYVDLGLCIFVSDGLLKSGLGVTDEQAVILSQLDSDAARDAMFHPWVQRTRERDPRWATYRDQLQDAVRYRRLYLAVAVISVVVIVAMLLLFGQRWNAVVPLILVCVFNLSFAALSHRRVRRYRSLQAKVPPT